MKEEGREVAEMGGLHIVGTERHEARRIDNQLRGRAGRQGDPARAGSSCRCKTISCASSPANGSPASSLASAWKMARPSKAAWSRRIEAAQKKVEEQNFDIRKNLLEYDEVMDHSESGPTAIARRFSNGANCKIRILDMLDQQIELALDRYLDRRTTASAASRNWP